MAIATTAGKIVQRIVPQNDAEGIAFVALLGGVINGGLTFLSGEGVSWDRAGARNNSWALEPTIPVPRFSADYRTPTLANIAYASAVGSIVGGLGMWFLLMSINAEQKQFEVQMRQMLRNTRR